MFRRCRQAIRAKATRPLRGTPRTTRARPRRASTPPRRPSCAGRCARRRLPFARPRVSDRRSIATPCPNNGRSGMSETACLSHSTRMRDEEIPSPDKPPLLLPPFPPNEGSAVSMWPEESIWVAPPNPAASPTTRQARIATRLRHRASWTSTSAPTATTSPSTGPREPGITELATNTVKHREQKRADSTICGPQHERGDRRQRRHPGRRDRIELCDRAVAEVLAGV